MKKQSEEGRGYPTLIQCSLNGGDFIATVMDRQERKENTWKEENQKYILLAEKKLVKRRRRR